MKSVQTTNEVLIHRSLPYPTKGLFGLGVKVFNPIGKVGILTFGVWCDKPFRLYQVLSTFNHYFTKFTFLNLSFLQEVNIFQQDIEHGVITTRSQTVMRFGQIVK